MLPRPWTQRARLVLASPLERPTSPAAQRALSALAFGSYLLLVGLGVAHHEVWRDEVRALTLALEPDSWLGLAQALENEGHPALWHLVLRLAHGLVGTPLVLPIATLLIGIGAAALVFFTAPLPMFWRVLFLFGWVPLIEGPVLCRNYGISMLLLFAFCRWAVQARQLLAAGALALLANTNVYGTMMAGGLGLFLVIELRRRSRSWGLVAGAGAMVAVGIAVAVYVMAPTSDSRLLSPMTGALVSPWHTALSALERFTVSTGPLFGVPALSWVVVLLLATSTLCMPHLACAVLLVFACAAWFMHGVYGAGPHHLGMLFAFMVAVTWLRAGMRENGGPRAGRWAFRVMLFGVWPALLLFQAARGLREIHREILCTNTGAVELASLLATEQLDDAILLGEPDYVLDAAPYYCDNRIFVAREDRFARRVSWTLANRRDLDLGELLATAHSLQRDHGVPVLFVIGRAIHLEQPAGALVHGYGSHFSWTAAQRTRFVEATQRVASLPAQLPLLGNEGYDVYLLR